MRIAESITFEDYLDEYAGEHCEWVRGTVIKMSPISLRHHRITRYLLTLLETYFHFRPIGVAVGDPFAMHLPDLEIARQPDIQVILKDNPGTLHETYMEGAADICIEVVSPESVSRDRGEKFAEYEQAGVKEYWIVDPLREQALFYVLEDGVYAPRYEDKDGIYESPQLPDLRVHVPTLWAETLPTPVEITKALEKLLG